MIYCFFCECGKRSCLMLNVIKYFVDLGNYGYMIGNKGMKSMKKV